MSWKDEEVDRCRRSEEQKKIAEHELEIQKEKIAEYWDKLVDANLRLDPRIRLTVGSNGNEIVNGIRGEDGQDALFFWSYRGEVTGHRLIIKYSCAEHRLFAVEPMLHERDNNYYDIDDSSIDVLLRNLCTHREITNGLKRRNALCFVATAVYGSSSAEQVMILRRFRDDVLLKHAFGVLLVRLYYVFSPAIAGYLRGRNIARHLLRECCLNPLVRCLKKRMR